MQSNLNPIILEFIALANMANMRHEQENRIVKAQIANEAKAHKKAQETFKRLKSQRKKKRK